MTTANKYGGRGGKSSDNVQSHDDRRRHTYIMLRLRLANDSLSAMHRRFCKAVRQVDYAHFHRVIAGRKPGADIQRFVSKELKEEHLFA